MKNVLKFYYGIDVLNIHQKNKNYYFHYDNNDYMFITCMNENINNIYNLSLKLNNYGFMSHSIILNKESQILTKVNEDNYILLKIYVEKRLVNFNDIINFSNFNYNLNDIKLNKYNWYDLWTNKVDYFEYQINQIGKKYPLIRESLSYYIGLSENAINLLKLVDEKKLYLTLSHSRVYTNNNTYDLYNPINFVLDTRIRDICEYFKDAFFNNHDINYELSYYLQNSNLNYDESICFMARMLFPTYYFDMYEKIISNEIEEDKIKSILYKTKEYEIILKNIQAYLKNIRNIPTIDWLNAI